MVNEYEVGDLSLYQVKTFEEMNSEWLHFVCACRKGMDVYKEYDVIIGNVADDDVIKCVNMYMDGLWDETRTLEELRYYEKNDQIAFLTQRVLDEAVKFIGSYEVE